MKTWIKLAFKELKNNKSFSIFFILNLSIGLIGFIVLSSFSVSLHNHFQINLKELLTADMVVYSNRPLKKEAIEIVDQVLGPDKQESRVITFYSMLAHDQHTRLAEVYAIDSAFPLYGQFALENSGSDSVNNISQKLHGQPGAWMTKDTAQSMQLQIGSKVKLGKKEFILNDYVAKDRLTTVTNIGIAPRIYVGMNQLKDTGLLDFGSRIAYQRYFRFPLNTNVKSLITELTETAKITFKDDVRPFRVMGTERVNRNLNRIITHFTSYMGLIGIIALFLAGIGAGYLFRNYFRKKQREIAILMSLGASRYQTYLVFITQIAFLGMLASLLSLLTSIFFLPILPFILRGIIPSDLDVTIGATIIARTFILGALGCLVFCIPTIINIHRLKPLTLLQNGHSQTKQDTKYSVLRIVSFFPAILLFWLLAVQQTNSFERGSIFLGGFIGVSIILSVFGILFFYICKLLSNSTNTFLRIAFRNLYRNKASTFSCFIAIALGAFLINIIPQLQNGLQEEISRPSGLSLPSFFLIDIQPEQLEPLQSYLKNQDVKLSNVSPMVVGVLEKVNGQSITETYHEGNERRRNRRRERNLSYRMELDASERIISGVPLTTEIYDFETQKPAEVSIAQGFAEHDNLKIDDLLEFDVQGITIMAKIVNLREVRWNSFRPNFYILFQNGVLNEAPKTFIASIPKMNSSNKSKIQNGIVKRFPNISMINISELVDQILGIADKVVFAINFMAYLSIFTGIMVVFSIARYEALRRGKEMNLLKILGASFKDIRSIISIEFGFLGFMATFFAIFLSLAASYILSYLFFNKLWQLKWEISALSLFVISTICVITALIGGETIIRQKASTILQHD
ncbi:MAG: FtsX-like permease family protein [Deltaproteobacteria bacterium]|nr:FtsX-like permease family protein [Deltaproteobacteria bacterium]